LAGKKEMNKYDESSIGVSRQKTKKTNQSIVEPMRHPELESGPQLDL
jgi:hypothetical protein